MNRICREVEAQLPSLVDGASSGWRRRAVERHLRRCAACSDEFARQRALADELARLGEAASDEAQPPVWLLDRLLEEAEGTGLRGRVAGPARGAVSGARPALSVALLLVAAAVGTATGYLGWRALRAIRGALTAGDRR